MDRGALLASTGVIVHEHCKQSAFPFRQRHVYGFIGGVLFPGEASCNLSVRQIHPMAVNYGAFYVQCESVL